jgi:hypothetical protein
MPRILSGKALKDLKKASIEADDFKAIIERLEEATPHIQFSNWNISDENGFRNPNLYGYAHYLDRSRRSMHCHLKIGDSDIYSEASARDRGTVMRSDKAVLDTLASEAGNLLHAMSAARVSLSDFGVEAVAALIARLLRIDPSVPRSHLRFFRSLSSETYENQRIPYGVILTRVKSNDQQALLEIENKRFKRLTDGFSTAITLDRQGGIVRLVSLRARRETSRSRLYRPWWLGPLADTTLDEAGVGIALTRGGDILVTYGGELLASQRTGRWRIWRHDPLLNTVRSAWDIRGNPGGLDDVLIVLYRVALELAFRRSGGLLVIAGSRNVANRLIPSARDRMDSERRSPAEKSLDTSLRNTYVQSLDRRVLTDLASLDGAVVVDRTGRLLAYGAMLRSATSGSAQGARTRAAVGASRFGLAMKVSSDGGISFYRNGVVVLDVG